MKVFAMNDCEWWAAESLEEAKADYIKETGVPEEDGPFDDPHELGAEAMNRLRFSDDDGSVRSFEAQLKKMVAEGSKFPCLFATTEY